MSLTVPLVFSAWLLTNQLFIYQWEWYTFIVYRSTTQQVSRSNILFCLFHLYAHGTHCLLHTDIHKMGMNFYLRACCLEIISSKTSCSKCIMPVINCCLKNVLYCPWFGKVFLFWTDLYPVLNHREQNGVYVTLIISFSSLLENKILLVVKIIFYKVKT